MTNALAVYNAAPNSIAEVKDVAGIFAQSGMFADTKQMAQAFVKIMAGQAMGFDPFSAMNGIHIIKGKPSMGAGLIAAAVDRHPGYDFTVIKHTEKECEIVFLKRRDGSWVEAGRSAFTLEDAKRAGLTSNATWTKYPKNMLYARAMSNGARWYCAGVFGGAVYTAEELGESNVDDDGGLIVDANYHEEAVVIEPESTPDPVSEQPEQDDPESEKADSDNKLTRAAADRIKSHAKECGANGDDLLNILQVTRLSEWQDGEEAALAAIDAWALSTN